MSKLDYCNVALAGLTSCDLDRLQSVINAAARLSPDSWRAAPRPHHSASCGPLLVAYTSAHPVQAVRTGLPVRSRIRTELSAERQMPGRECGITASPALCIIGRSHRAGDATYNNGRQRAPSQHRAPGTVCRTRSVAAHLWLSSNVHWKLSLLYSVFLLTLSLITF